MEMYKILKKEYLNPTVVRMVVEAPEVARRADAGQFIILRATEDGERIPLTVADYDRENGSVTIIFQVVGATTETLRHLEEGDYIVDFAGPLGRKTETEGLKSVAVVGGDGQVHKAHDTAQQSADLVVVIHQCFELFNDGQIAFDDLGGLAQEGLDAVDVGAQGGIVEALVKYGKIPGGVAHGEVPSFVVVVRAKGRCPLESRLRALPLGIPCAEAVSRPQGCV